MCNNSPRPTTHHRAVPPPQGNHGAHDGDITRVLPQRQSRPARSSQRPDCQLSKVRPPVFFNILHSSIPKEGAQNVLRCISDFFEEISPSYILTTLLSKHVQAGRGQLRGSELQRRPSGFHDPWCARLRSPVIISQRAGAGSSAPLSPHPAVSGKKRNRGANLLF